MKIGTEIIDSGVKHNPLSFEDFYRTFYSSADAISMAAISELEYQASQVGLAFEPSYLARHQSKGRQLKYLDKKFQGKGIVYCDDKSTNGIDYHFLTFKTHKHGGQTTTFSGYSWLLEQYQHYKQDKALKPQKPLYLQKHDELQSQRLANKKTEEQALIDAKEYRDADLSLFESLTAASPSNEYLVKKQLPFKFKATDLREGIDNRGKYLAYEVVNVQGEVQGLQKIYNNFKSFTKGMNKKGSFSVVGALKPNSEIFVVTGLADALTVHHVLGGQYTVVNALDDNNIEHVVQAIREHFYRVRFTLVCDNDVYNTKAGNSGVRKGLNASILVNAKHIVVNFKRYASSSYIEQHKPTDINDLYQLVGSKATKKVLKNKSKVSKKPYQAALWDLLYGGTRYVEKHIVAAINKLMQLCPSQLSLQCVTNKVILSLPEGLDNHLHWTQFIEQKCNQVFFAKKQGALAFKTIPLHSDVEVIEVDSFSDVKQKMLAEGGCYILDAAMGVGKTKFKGEIAEGMRGFGQPVYITARESLTRQAGERLKLENYQDTKKSGFYLDSLAICLNSIIKPKFQGIVNHAKALFVDEISQVIRHCATGSVEQPELVLETFKNSLANAPLIVCGDADANEEVIQLLKEARPFDKITIVRIKRNPVNKDLYYTLDHSVVVQEIFAALEQDLPTFVMSDSRTQVAELVYKMKQSFPDKKILQVDSQTKGGEAKAFIENPDATIEQYDAVFCSPAVSTGLSIEKAYFKKHFALFGGRTVIPQDAFQMLNRDRTATSFLIGLTDKKSYDQTNPNLILNDKKIGFQSNIKLDHDLSAHSESLYTDTHVAFNQLYASIKAQENKQRNDFSNNFLLIAMTDGYHIEMIEAGSNKLGKNLIKEAKKDRLQSYIADLNKQKKISDEQAHEIRRNYMNSYEAMLQFERYCIEKALGTEDLDEQDLEFALKGGTNHVRNLVNFLLDNETLKQKDEALIKKGVPIVKQKNLLLRKKIQTLIFNTLGIDKHTGEGFYDSAKANHLIEELSKIKQEFNSCGFGVKLVDKIAYPIRFINNLLRQLFGFKIDSKNPMTEGVRAGRIYWIDSESFVQVMQYVINRCEHLHTSDKFNTIVAACVQQKTLKALQKQFSECVKKTMAEMVSFITLFSPPIITLNSPL